MGIPVIISPFGLPVRQVEGNAPLMTVSSNGFGVPIMLSDRGFPFVVEGVTPPVPLPGSIIDLAVLSTTTSTIALSFTNAHYATSHQYSLDGGDWEPLATDKIITGLEEATEYLVRVRGVNASGEGDPSNEVEAETAATIPDLGILLLSEDVITEDDPVTIDILGATAGSTIAVQSGALPNGLTLNSGARTISGTPTVVDEFSFTLRETLAGSSNSPRDNNLSIEVEAAIPDLGALSLSQATAPEDSPVTINILGATAGSTITVQSGALPDGLTLNSGARTISGTPTVVDEFSFTLRETLTGSSNSPRDTALDIEVTGVVPIPTTSETSVTSNGITFTFAAAREVGYYETGDPFVVIPSGGNVTVTSTSPASAQHSGLFANGVDTFTDEWLDGMMLNPAAGTTGLNNIPQGFNSISSALSNTASTIQPYSGAVNIDPGANSGAPVVLTTPGTLVKAKGPTSSLPNDGREGLTTDMAALTVVSDVPLEGAFRPQGSDSDKASYFFLSDVDVSWLPSYALPDGATAPDHATALARVNKLYQTFFTNLLYVRGHNPTNQQQAYGRDISMEVGEVLLYLCLATPTTEQKAEIAKFIVQIGLDVINKGIDGGTWGPPQMSGGGGQHWPKVMAAFAAKALEGASNTTKAEELQEWADPDQHIFMTEDRIFRTVNRLQIETAPTRHSSGNFREVQYPNYSENAPMWNSKPSDPALTSASWSAAYRLNVLGSILGASLAARMMGLTDKYLDAYFAYMDMWFDYAKVGESWGPDAPTSFTQAMLDEYWDALSPRAQDTAAPSVARVVARGNDVWIEFDKMLSRTAIPASSAFVVNVNGSPATISTAAAQVTTEPYALQTPNIYGYSMAVRLAAALSPGDAVTIAYTQPGSNQARTIAGTLVPSITATAATNLTGTLPEAATTKDVVYTGATKALRQYSMAAVPPAQTIERMRLSLRFWLSGAPVAGETILTSLTGSSTNFRLYWASASDLRLLIGSENYRMPGIAAILPRDKLITMHIAVDYTATTTATRYKIEFKWDGDSYAPEPGANSTVVTTATTKAIATIWHGGIVLGPTTSGVVPQDNAFSGGFSELTIGWGGAGYDLPANFNGSEFAWNADWGGNGESVWGINQLYYAGSLDEWNTSVINRGNGNPASMSARRITEEGALITPYVAAGI